MARSVTLRVIFESMDSELAANISKLTLDLDKSYSEVLQLKGAQVVGAVALDTFFGNFTAVNLTLVYNRSSTAILDLTYTNTNAQANSIRIPALTFAVVGDIDPAEPVNLASTGTSTFDLIALGD